MKNNGFGRQCDYVDFDDVSAAVLTADGRNKDSMSATSAHPAFVEQGRRLKLALTTAQATMERVLSVQHDLELRVARMVEMTTVDKLGSSTLLENDAYESRSDARSSSSVLTWFRVSASVAPPSDSHQHAQSQDLVYAKRSPVIVSEVAHFVLRGTPDRTASRAGDDALARVSINTSEMLDLVGVKMPQQQEREFTEVGDACNALLKQYTFGWRFTHRKCSCVTP
jgi:hypothetical protein